MSASSVATAPELPTPADSTMVPARRSNGNGYGVTQLRVLRSEWTKFRSLRSPAWTLLISVVLTVGIGALISAAQGSRFDSLPAVMQQQFDPIAVSLSGLNFAELAIGVLGVLVISGEYGTGMIRSSLTVVPRRLPVLWAKIGVTAAVVFVVMLIASFAAFFVGQALLDQYGHGVGIGADGALRSILGGALAIMVVAAHRAGGRRAAAQHRRGDLDIRRGVLRAAAADEPAAGLVVEHHHPVPAQPGRRRPVPQPHPGGPDAGAVGRVRGALRIRGGAGRRGCLATAQAGRLTGMIEV